MMAWEIFPGLGVPNAGDALILLDESQTLAVQGGGRNESGCGCGAGWIQERFRKKGYNNKRVGLRQCGIVRL